MDAQHHQFVVSERMHRLVPCLAKELCLEFEERLQSHVDALKAVQCRDGLSECRQKELAQMLSRLKQLRHKEGRAQVSMRLQKVIGAVRCPTPYSPPLTPLPQEGRPATWRPQEYGAPFSKPLCEVRNRERRVTGGFACVSNISCFRSLIIGDDIYRFTVPASGPHARHAWGRCGVHGLQGLLARQLGACWAGAGERGDISGEGDLTL